MPSRGGPRERCLAIRSLASTSTLPVSRSSLTIPLYPRLAASQSGVWPSSSSASTSTLPVPRSSLTIPSCPPAAAHESGVSDLARWPHHSTRSLWRRKGGVILLHYDLGPCWVRHDGQSPPRIFSQPTMILRIPSRVVKNAVKSSQFQIAFRTDQIFLYCDPNPQKSKRGRCTGHKTWYWMPLPVVFGAVGYFTCRVPLHVAPLVFNQCCPLWFNSAISFCMYFSNM
jgi:hypothetical protein